MRGRLPHPILVVLLLLVLKVDTMAQGGIRLIIWNYGYILSDRVDQQFGVGYDHDLTERTSLSVGAMYSTANAWMVQYRSAYHLAPNDGASFYVGPTLAYHKYENEVSTVPVGIRIGLRGGLARFYADLHAGYAYTIGAGEVLLPERTLPIDITKHSFCAGLDLGWGWDR